MWQMLDHIRILNHNLLSKLLVRLILLIVVCFMQVYIEPHICHITELELQNYKRLPRESYVPLWAMVCLIVFVPFLFLSLPLLLARNYMDTTQALLAWTLALAINALITETAKLVTGRPRPDFFYRCYPNGKESNQSRYAGNMKDIIEGRKSFPSGHSSFSFCSLGFLSMWLCGRLGVLSWNRGHVLRSMCCLLPVILASAIAFSRYYDNHHHWEDVVVGSVLGFLLAYICYRQYYNLLCAEVSDHSYISRDILLQDFQCCARNLVPISVYNKRDA